MKTVWKSVLEKDVGPLSIPVGAEFLTAQSQDNHVSVWYRCDPKAPTKSRWFAVVATGQDCPPDWDYLATVKFGVLVFHVFVKPEEL